MLSVHTEEELLADCKIVTLQNSDILDGQENNESVAVLGNTEKVVALENIDILIAVLERIVSVAKWVVDTAVAIVAQTLEHILVASVGRLQVVEEVVSLQAAEEFLLFCFPL